MQDTNLKTFFHCLHWQQACPPGVNPQRSCPPEPEGWLPINLRQVSSPAGRGFCLPSPSINTVYAHSPLLMVPTVGTGAFHLHSAAAQNLAPSEAPAPRCLPAPSIDSTSCSIDEGCSFLLLHFQVPIKPPHHLSLLSVWISASQTAQLIFSWKGPGVQIPGWDLCWDLCWFPLCVHPLSCGPSTSSPGPRPQPSPLTASRSLVLGPWQLRCTCFCLWKARLFTC